MKKKQKITIILFLTIIFIVFLIQFSYGAFSVKDLTGTPVNNNQAKKMGNITITALSTIGSLTSVICLIIIGIKYMMGSIEEKATYKKSLMPYIIGSIIVFGASFFAGVIYRIAP